METYLVILEHDPEVTRLSRSARKALREHNQIERQDILGELERIGRRVYYPISYLVDRRESGWYIDERGYCSYYEPIDPGRVPPPRRRRA